MTRKRRVKVRDITPLERIVKTERQMQGMQGNGAISDAGQWMRSHGVSPGWTITGAAIGAIVDRSAVEGVIKGAALGALLSWLSTKL